MKKTNNDEILHWADQAAERIIKEKGDKASYCIASGITPSGTVHIGNFREIITTDLIARALRSRGKKVRFIYSLDDFDVFRKVPANMPKPELLRQYLRKPIVDTPDTFGCHKSYAEHHEKEVEETVPRVGITTEFLYQAKKYRSGEYAKEMKHALENTEAIVKILNQFREEPLEKEWLPVSLFCEKCGKDHSTVGGSYDTGKDICNQVWDFDAPSYVMYDFISLKGMDGKMSSSKGDVITLKDVLEVYEPEIT